MKFKEKRTSRILSPKLVTLCNTIAKKSLPKIVLRRMEIKNKCCSMLML